MRIFAKSVIGVAESPSYVIPCEDLGSTIGDLKKSILTRQSETLAESNKDLSEYKLLLAGCEAILSDQDLVQDVLQDGDVVLLKDSSGTVAVDDTIDTTTLPCYGISLCQALASTNKAMWIELDGNSLSIEDLIKIGKGEYLVMLSKEATEAINNARKHIDGIVRDHKVVYGVTTGFGKFARVVVEGDKLVELQESLIRSHAAGVGPPLHPEQTRRLLTLRINVLAKGFSGIRLETVEHLINALNASCLPYIPEKGTVGASGDLAPLSHLALGMMGEGLMWSPKTGWGQAKDVLEAHNLQPITLAPKEGISLINGTQFISAIGAEAIFRAELITKQADIIAALSLDVLQGTPRAFDPAIHANRPHPGQQKVASRLRALLDSSIHPSEIREGHKNCHRVQDPYSLRCIPQVHGIVNDTIEFVKGIITTEMNSALDNPMVFADREETISGGNFHGEYPAKAMDYLAIGVHELANMSERRQERLVNPFYSELPAFLVNQGGLNSGFMIAHCTSAALVSENKVLTHPSSVDSISTSAGTEDHVSMGGFAARKALEVVEHVEQVMAIELLSACQGLEFHRPKKTTKPLEEVHKLVRSVVRPWDKDRFFSPDINAVSKLLREGKVWETTQAYIERYQSEAS